MHTHGQCLLMNVGKCCDTNMHHTIIWRTTARCLWITICSLCHTLPSHVMICEIMANPDYFARLRKFICCDVISNSIYIRSLSSHLAIKSSHPSYKMECCFLFQNSWMLISMVFASHTILYFPVIGGEGGHFKNNNFETTYLFIKTPMETQ